MKKTHTTRRAMMAHSLALLGAGALAAPAADAATATAGAWRVVFQVSDADPKKWGLTLNNVKNVQQELGAQHIAVEIVVYGPGIGMLLAEAEIANRVIEAMQAGVAVLACENTMRAQHLSRDDMIAKIGFVAAGVVQLIKRQAEGYAYIRA
ncbi:MAG: DsrE family protein [Pseudomonadota bacterium]|nr:DsrE family protein [Pseudomonadota bacterium]